MIFIGVNISFGGSPGIRRGSAGGMPLVRWRLLRGFAGGILKTRKSAGPGAGVAGDSPWVYEIETPGSAGPGAGPVPVPTQMGT